MYLKYKISNMIINFIFITIITFKFNIKIILKTFNFIFLKINQS